MFTDLKIAAERRELTASESRISIAVGSIITLLIAASIFEDFSPKGLSVLFFFLFWMPMLVLHEIGHALMARLLGWRVHEIVIGFGRTLWQGRIGATTIKIKLAPIEGYVLPAPLDSGNVRLKSALIYAAGPGAELLLLAAMLAIFGWDGVFNQSNDLTLIAVQSLAVVILFGAGFNLIPFQSGGGVSDGLGVISSPFMSKEIIELRLLTIELRDIQKKFERQDRVAPDVENLLQLYPDNQTLQTMLGYALSSDGQDDHAREYVRDNLDNSSLTTDERRVWLHLQAIVELNAATPSYLVLDSALQKAMRITPNATDLNVTKGASLVMRGQFENGGNLLANTWRSSEGGDDQSMLAYLTIAAHQIGDSSAKEHFEMSFRQVNRSEALRRRVEEMTSRRMSVVTP